MNLHVVLTFVISYRKQYLLQSEWTSLRTEDHVIVSATDTEVQGRLQS